MRFPKHRPPRDISDHERLIGYAVEKGKVFLVQTRAGGIRIQPPYGPKGSVTYRWPNEMDVETHAWVPNLKNAPELKAVLPDFMDKYRKKFWRGSHWLIDDAEYDALEAAVIAAGKGKKAPMPPRRLPQRSI